jgi:hypothetical protein
MDTNRPVVLIAFGMLLGASIGFADGLIGLRTWLMLGRPNFFIRPNWGEELHVISLTFSGALAGILYGGFLVRLSQTRTDERFRLARIYCSSMILALPVFFCTHYYVIAHRVLLMPVPFIPEIAVFLLSIGLALCLGTEKRSPKIGVVQDKEMK